MSIDTLDREEIIGLVAAKFNQLGDIYTDADELAASVKAAKNLEVVATRLCGQVKAVATGYLVANGYVPVSASVDIAGRLTFEDGAPDMAGAEELELLLEHKGKTVHLPVTGYPYLHHDDEDSYVLTDVNGLLDILLGLV